MLVEQQIAQYVLFLKTNFHKQLYDRKLFSAMWKYLIGSTDRTRNVLSAKSTAQSIEIMDIISGQNLVPSFLILLSLIEKGSQKENFHLGTRRRNNHNILMSLPTFIIHWILTDLLDAVLVIKLDYALASDDSLHLPFRDILKSDQYFMQKVYRTKRMELYEESPSSKHPYSEMVCWLIFRQVKVVGMELHEHCCCAALEDYLQRYGEHVRRVSSREDYKRTHEEQNTPSQNQLISKYCHKLTSYTVNTHKLRDGNILSVLNNNINLETLNIKGDMRGENSLFKSPLLALPHLKQLEWSVRYGFDRSLVALAQAAPNLLNLSLTYIFDKNTEIDGALILAVAKACPQLRTFRCKDMLMGPNDSVLPQFLAICRNIENLDLNGHYMLTDNVLTSALSELLSLNCLDLRGCCMLTDHTFKFLAQRFASTLKILYLDHSNRGKDKGDALVTTQEQPGGYTAAGIASLRAQCTHVLKVFL